MVGRSLEQFDRALQVLIARHQSLEFQGLDAQERSAPNFDVLQREPHFVFADILDKNGQAIASRPRNTNNWSGRDYFDFLEHDPHDSLYVGGRFSVDNERDVGITVSRRLTDRDANFSGVVVIGIRLAYFRDLLRHIELDSNQSMMLLRDDDVILLRLPSLPDTAAGKLDHGSSLYAAMRTGNTSVVAPDPIDNIERRFVLHRVGTFPLVICVGTAATGLVASSVLWLVVVAGCATALGFAMRRIRRWRSSATASTDRAS
jgi:hypothetical protein